MSSFGTSLFLFSAGVLGGAMNAAAGGGSFVTLPALVYAGLPTPAASASGTVALFPGRLASAWVYRTDLGAFASRVSLRAMAAASAAGGVAGALVLLRIKPAHFDAAVPWLLLGATLAFAGGPQLSAALRRTERVPAWVLLAGQFVLCAYAGLFGGAAGILTMAFWSLAGLTDVKAMNAAKAVLLGVANAASVALFASAGAVRWALAAWVLAGAVLGGYAGARLTQRVTAGQLRVGLSAFNVAVTGAFFVRAGL